MNTHQQWLEQAHELGLKSNDPIQVGCVIVSADGELLSSGWNHVPDGVDDTAPRYTIPAKYFWIEHAEQIAIYKAAKDGIRLSGATAYINYSPDSICTNCIRALIQSGIVRFVGTSRVISSKNRKHHHTVNQYMIKEANIETITIDN